MTGPPDLPDELMARATEAVQRAWREARPETASSAWTPGPDLLARAALSEGEVVENVEIRFPCEHGWLRRHVTEYDPAGDTWCDPVHDPITGSFVVISLDSKERAWTPSTSHSLG